MEKFINTNHNITDIVLAIWVAPGMGSAVHKNRPSHGLAFNCAGEKVYAFSDGTKYVVKENDIDGILTSIRRVKEGKISRQACREYAIERFDKQKNYLKYLELFSDILG